MREDLAEDVNKGSLVREKPSEVVIKLPEVVINPSEVAIKRSVLRDKPGSVRTDLSVVRDKPSEERIHPSEDAVREGPVASARHRDDYALASGLLAPTSGPGGTVSCTSVARRHTSAWSLGKWAVLADVFAGERAPQTTRPTFSLAGPAAPAAQRDRGERRRLLCLPRRTRTHPRRPWPDRSVSARETRGPPTRRGRRTPPLRCRR